MEASQLGLQIAYLLRQATWAEAPAAAVLVDAFVSDDLDGDFLPTQIVRDGPTTRALPFARVAVVDVERDPESKKVQQTVRVLVVGGGGGIAQATAGNTTPAAGTAGTYDTHGLNQETGANRDVAASFGQGRSTGRSVDEVCARLIEYLNSGSIYDSGFGFQGLAREMQARIPVDGVQVVARPIEIIAYGGTVARYYHTVFRLRRATGDPAGTVNLSWVAAPPRFDLFRYVLRRAAGSTAPTGPTDGTNVPITGGVLGTSATDSGLAPGTYTYGHFVQCDETHATPIEAQRTSEVYPLTVVVA